MAATFCLIVVCAYADVTEQIRTSSPYALRADGADAQRLRNGFTVKCCTISFYKMMICIFYHNPQLNVGAICAERKWRRRSDLIDCLARERTSAPYALRADGADVQRWRFGFTVNCCTIFKILICKLQFSIDRRRHLRGAHMATTFGSV